MSNPIRPIDNRRIFDDLGAIRSRDPLAFDDHHPFIGKLFSDPHFLEDMQGRFERHPARFKFYHPGGWRVVAGAHRDPIPPCPPPPPKCEVACPPPVSVPEPDSSSLMANAFAIIVICLFAYRSWKSR